MNKVKHPLERPERRQILGASLLVSAACAPFIHHLEPQILAFLALVLGVRFIALRWPAALPNPWLRALLAFAGIANCLAAYHTLNGRDGGSALLLSMLALKLLELDGRRDLRLVLILSGFVCAVLFLFEDSFFTTLYVALIAFALVVLLIELQGGLPDAGLKTAARIGTQLALQSAPLTLVLFVLFPRLDAPLWNLGPEQSKGTSGLTESLEPGNLSELVLNDEPAFRVRFAGERPSTERLYWRALVLWQTDGRRWTQGTSPTPSPAPLINSDRPIAYEIVLEPTDQRWLFALDLPLAAPEGSILGPEHQLIADQPVSVLKRYRLTSALDYRTAEPGEAARALALAVPAWVVTPRMRRLVEGWRVEHPDDWAVVQQALVYFNREAFHYTLIPPPLGANPIDGFLFETRSGYCEHYASSFAILMRLAGIPARVILGYLGGEENTLGGYTLVRQSDAHAWVEIAIRGRGWVRVDPTAAVDPRRIDRRAGARLLSPRPVRLELEAPTGLVRWARNLRLFADTLEATWQNWVLDFSVKDQRRLLERLGFDNWGEYGLAGLMILAVSSTLGTILLVLMRERSSQDPLEQLYARLCQELARRGVPRLAHEGPLDYGRRVAALRPELAPWIEGFLRLYVPARYGGKVGPETLKDLVHALKRRV
ncbi:DUF3488 domain-containing transglutaminase family protein [Caldichromatium japonicum]|uniref:DUF3488 domain-containing transglutaminase family protein n=1 Tax=Caldichromatium japonicum TaxID=2699430 RepID=A0A6G7VA82_9GAMM|nr:DUF3488 and transglutaminase-like domain-containing protein [Caldichromatium japonicum]QIK36697.1 DUF3488 domain-containing transglutaminase family protein [Caldichromatium japonicum]